MLKKKSSQGFTKDDMQDLLAEQSKIILGAVDEKIGKLEKSFKSGLAITEVRIVADIDKKLVAMELRINQKFDKLTTYSGYGIRWKGAAARIRTSRAAPFCILVA